MFKRLKLPEYYSSDYCLIMQKERMKHYFVTLNIFIYKTATGGRSCFSLSRKASSFPGKLVESSKRFFSASSVQYMKALNPWCQEVNDMVPRCSVPSMSNNLGSEKATGQTFPSSIIAQVVLQSRSGKLQ